MKRIFPIAIFFLLLLGGYGFDKMPIEIIGFLFSLAFLFYSFNLKKKITLPKGFFAFVLTLFLIAASFIWSVDRGLTLEYLLLFMTGGIFWVSTYNLKDKKELGFERLMVFLGISYSLLYLLFTIQGKNFGSWSLVFPASSYHHHIGDFWAVVLAAVSVSLVDKKSLLKKVPITLFGLIFVALSLSRSAHLALGAGIIFVFLKAGKIKRRYIYLLLGIASIFFIATGFSKPTLLARPYFVQGAVGLFRNPIGVGMGNFGEISADPLNQIGEMDSFSTNAHSVIFEVLAGIGFFGFVFIYWLTKKVMDIWGQNNNLAPKASFIALTVNFLFDSTYFIPTMLWIWFILLGLSEEG